MRRTGAPVRGLVNRKPEQGRWLAQVVRGYFAYHAPEANFRPSTATPRRVRPQMQRALCLVYDPQQLPRALHVFTKLLAVGDAAH
jgi:hypothetical protein